MSSANKPLKRPRESVAAPTSSSADGGKRVKFAPSDAAKSFAGGDEFEEDLETGGSKKKSVMTDGYDSDSSAGSDDEFGGGGGRKKGKDGAEGGADEDDDMFGDGGDAAKDDKGKGKAKEKEFLESGDIEGQIFKDDDDDEEDDEDEEEEYMPDDDLANNDDAPRSRRSKKSMGYKLSSFNMEEELAEGRFSGDGSYVANANDPLATHDSWLDGVSKSAIKAARLSKKKMEDEARKREESEGRKGEAQIDQDRDDCLLGILGIVREGETVAGALARLGAKKRAKVEDGSIILPKKVVTKRPTEDGDGDATMEMDAEPSSTTPSSTEVDPITRKINLLTHFASTLLSAHGEIEIYDQQHSDIVKRLREEGAVRRDWVPPVDPDIEVERLEKEAAAAAKHAEDGEGRSGNRVRVVIARGSAAPAPKAIPDGKWWYKWNTPPAGQPADAEYGPYSTQELTAWVGQGYFGNEGANVSVRRDNSGAKNWVAWKDAA